MEDKSTHRTTLTSAFCLSLSLSYLYKTQTAYDTKTRKVKVVNSRQDGLVTLEAVSELVNKCLMK